MTYKIEKGIPVSDARIKKSKYPFRDMEVGDSFFIDLADADASSDSCFSIHRWAGNHRCAAYKFGRENNLKFKTTMQNDGLRICGLRIWRVK